MTDDDVNDLFPARADSLSAPLPLVLTVEQAAERLGVGRTVMYALVSSGAVESVQIPGHLLGRAPSRAPRSPGVTRQANGRSTIYQGSDGYWHGRVIVGVTDQGKPDRRHVMSRSKSVVAARVRELEKKREIGNVPLPGIRWTVAGWLEHWLENIARPTIRRSSYDAYRIAVRVHLIPGLGDHRLDRLRPEHLERLYRRMIANGARPATAHQVHRTIRTALGEAVRRRQVQENVATLAKAPKIETKELEPYSIAEVRRILTAARERRNAARWAIALSLGLRQGEVLGLRWSDIDLEAGILKITTNRVRPHYEHGCSTPCGKTPGHCTHRVQTNEDDGPTKSSAGKRKIGLPPQLLQLLEDHRYQQDQERTRAGRLWGETGEFSQTGSAARSSRTPTITPGRHC
jgi:integrase